MSALLRSCRDATRRSTSAGVMPGAVCRAWLPSLSAAIHVQSASGHCLICGVLLAAAGKHGGHGNSCAVGEALCIGSCVRSAVLGACLQQRCVGEHEGVHAVGSCQIPQVIQGLAHLADLQHGHSLSLKVKPEIRPQ